MTSRIDIWKKRLSPKPYIPRGVTPQEDFSAKSKVSAFSRDIQSLTYASPYRRLQGKTQVHPFPIFDYLRTRLTHSLEVAHVGRTIAATAFRELNYASDLVNERDVGDVVYAACLAHDLGNPPFGHIGEYAIQTWFTGHKSKIVHDLLQEPEKGNDFRFFDGNAQGFRIITRLAGWRQEGGLRLTLATLGAFSKYPYPSTMASETKPKFGYMENDEDGAKKIFGELEQPQHKFGFKRHPLAYVVEAADDICYLTTDIEDAHRMKLIDLNLAQQRLTRIAEMGGDLLSFSAFEDEKDWIAYLRNAAVLSMTNEVVAALCDKENLILKGELEKGLIENSKLNSAAVDIRNTCKERIYLEANKLKTEAAGYEIIFKLLDVYGAMVLQLLEKKSEEKLDPRQRAIFHLMPAEYRKQLGSGDPYICFLTLVDYVSGMTDRYALDLCSKLSGTSITIGRMTYPPRPYRAFLPSTRELGTSRSRPAHASVFRCLPS